MSVFSRTFLRFGEVVRDDEGHGGGRGTRHEMRLCVVSDRVVGSVGVTISRWRIHPVLKKFVNGCWFGMRGLACVSRMRTTSIRYICTYASKGDARYTDTAKVTQIGQLENRSPILRHRV
jgi:hypothetical protein